MNTGSGVQIVAKSAKDKEMRLRVAKRAAAEIKPNMYVNLGIGMPTTVANFVDPESNVFFHGENGLMGIGGYPKPGKEDPDTINAGKETVTVRRGGSCVASSMAFSIIRGNHLDLSILGGLEVSANGDLSNWIIPGKLVKGMGGAMDLCASVRKIIVLMNLTDKYGDKKFKKTGVLPITGPGCTSMLIGNEAVFEWKADGVWLKEVAKGKTVENIRQITDVEFKVPENVPYMEDNFSKYTGAKEEDIFAL